MEKKVDRIAFAMITGIIIVIFLGMAILMFFSSDEDVVFNDFKEKTKKFKENNEYVFLDNVSKKIEMKF